MPVYVLCYSQVYSNRMCAENENTDGWAVGALLPLFRVRGLKKKRANGKGVWVRYSSNGKREDWLHDCNDHDYAKLWFMLVRGASKNAHSLAPTISNVCETVSLPPRRSALRVTQLRAVSYKQDRAGKKHFGPDVHSELTSNNATINNKKEKRRINIGPKQDGDKPCLPITMGPVMDVAKHVFPSSKDISDYEKSRLANIKRNQDLLVSLGIFSSAD
jgi:hypothetical protein